MLNSDSTPERSGSSPFMRRRVVASAVIITFTSVGLLLMQANSSPKGQGDGSGSNFNHAMTAQGDSTAVEAEILGEPYHFEHAVVNK